MLKFLYTTLIVLIFIGCFDSKTTPKKETNTTKERNITKKEENITTSYSYEIEEITPQQLELKSDFETYLEHLKTLNTDGIVEMTYPGLFKPINKNLFIKFINTLLDSPEIAIENFDANITNIGEIIDYEDGKFANLEYIYAIDLTFVDPKLYKDELSMRVLKSVLENKYGKENIRVDKNSRSVMIKKREKLLAIKDKNSTSWKFLGDNSEYRRLYPEILPPKLLELLQPL